MLCGSLTSSPSGSQSVPIVRIYYAVLFVFLGVGSGSAFGIGPFSGFGKVSGMGSGSGCLCRCEMSVSGSGSGFWPVSAWGVVAGPYAGAESAVSARGKPPGSPSVSGAPIYYAVLFVFLGDVVWFGFRIEYLSLCSLCVTSFSLI